MPLDMYEIEGGRPLRGTVAISGSKNSCLALMAAAMLAPGPSIIDNVPDLRDIRSMIELLEHQGAKCSFRLGGRLEIDAKGFDTPWVPYEIMRKMRASMYAFGPTIARLGRASVSKPGGCAIGSRPIDLHLKGFQALGVQMSERKGYIHARHAGLRGTDMVLLGKSGPSVGATCNVLMAAVLAEGRTIIRGAACEPEVQELCHFLVKMGAHIEGIGSGTLTIEGVRELRPVLWRVAPDRIEAATFAVGAVITDGDVLLKDCDPACMNATLWALGQWGAQIDQPDETTLRIRRGDGVVPKALELVTAPYPHLATDVQAAFVALLGITPGHSSVRDTIYADRFMHVEELNRLGACMRQYNDTVEIVGVPHYEGAAVMASDLRAGAALTLAALAAQGESHVRRIYHVERGYEKFEQKLAKLGAQIRKAKEEDSDPGLEAMLAEDAEIMNAPLAAAEVNVEADLETRS